MINKLPEEGENAPNVVTGSQATKCMKALVTHHFGNSSSEGRSTEMENGFKTGGLKYDSDKPPMDLISGHFLKQVALALKFGAERYGRNNWRKGIEQSRLIAAALRHITAYNEGEDTDPESGLSHIAHAACCLMFLSELSVTRPDLDDRYKHVRK